MKPQKVVTLESKTGEYGLFCKDTMACYDKSLRHGYVLASWALQRSPSHSSCRLPVCLTLHSRSFLQLRALRHHQSSSHLPLSRLAPHLMGRSQALLPAAQVYLFFKKQSRIYMHLILSKLNSYIIHHNLKNSSQRKGSLSNWRVVSCKVLAKIW